MLAITASSSLRLACGLDLAELFGIGRSTVYRTIERAGGRESF
jgi:hypothetical protein